MLCLVVVIVVVNIVEVVELVFIGVARLMEMELIVASAEIDSETT